MSVLRNIYETLGAAWRAPYQSIEQTNDDGELERALMRLIR